MISENGVYVWDRFVRFFHWSLVVTFTSAYLTGDEAEALHAYLGYIVLALILSRVIWGLIGSRYARFSSFVFPASEIRQYWRSLLQRQPIYYRGHNPVGGIMVILLLISIFISCWTGLVAYGKEGYGPLAQMNQWPEWTQLELTPFNLVYANNDDHDDRDNEGKDEFWEEIHETTSNFALFLILLHIAGVIVASHLHGENLVRAMLTGYKKSDDE